MARYVMKINDGNEDLYDHVLSENKFYQECVQKYKNTVSHSFGAKEEIWLSLFMNPVYNLEYVILAHEFGKTKGVVICNLAYQVVATVDTLDEYTSSVYTVEEHEASFGHSP
eukprot:14569119-Ditylum_brightwellii.AAC.1